MKNITIAISPFSFLAFLSLSLYGSEPQQIVIKNAKSKHLPEVEQLTQAIFFEDFKPILEKGYSDNPIIQAGHTNTVLEQWLIARKEFYENSIEGKDGKKLIIAQGINKKLLGICNFEKQENYNNINRSYIVFMAVAPEARKHGIGTKLLMEAQTTWNDVNYCELATLDKANEATQQFYEKRGFSNKGLISIDERAPESHRLYSKEILKQ